MEVQQRLGGRYTLLNELGSGGMAVVWRAQDEVLGRPVAVKVLAGRYVGDPQSRSRIRAEARAAATLSHPNIAQVYDFGESPENGVPQPYVVMELINGPTLAQRVSLGPLPVRSVFRVGSEVAAALAAAHSDGLVHRDIKPANVMVTPSGAKVVDFGIAAVAGPVMPDEQLLGTPAYLAPERLTGDAVQPASDVYALGVLLYRLLADQSPWSVDTTTQMLDAHVYVEPAPLPELPEVPPVVAELVNRCLSKEPARRPTAAEVRTVLADAAEASASAAGAGRADASGAGAGAGVGAVGAGVGAGASAGNGLRGQKVDESLIGDDNAELTGSWAGIARGLNADTDPLATQTPRAADPERREAGDRRAEVASAGAAGGAVASAGTSGAGASAGTSGAAGVNAGPSGAAGASAGATGAPKAGAAAPKASAAKAGAGTAGGANAGPLAGEKAGRARRKRLVVAGGSVALVVVAALLAWLLVPDVANGEQDDFAGGDGRATVAPTVAAQPGAEPDDPAELPSENGGGDAGAAGAPAAGGSRGPLVPPGAGPGEATPAPGGSGSGTPDPEPEPSASASSAPGGKRTTINNDVGIVEAECVRAKAHLTSWTAKDPYVVERVNAGPVLAATAVFKNKLSRVRMTVTCVAGIPTAVVLPL